MTHAARDRAQWETGNGEFLAASLAWLRSAHVTTVVLHRAEFARLKGESQLTRIDASPDLAEAGLSGDIELLTVKGR